VRSGTQNLVCDTAESPRKEVLKLLERVLLDQQIKRFIENHIGVQIYPFGECLRLILRNVCLHGFE
jgi:hypothetical protein